ncbi:uncharacterized protein BO97DRAFT_219131 [Aspergillus homomorphus CBS 101889]|uniref:Uncharacterized protein n=1 Tax=Aspergillus homomorphus (strain CBS 101889) TaxID=1450537 RepID=A0A395I6I8_ASPHC|nr:hypothetical protein BO97DRAFT_219131 [Aspergillus homomorphus CBS 101889]RAL15657.1 hypothetical protein BO97DRAFT_219131 [Aspergillus homomorphus CBS 101889]
MDSYDTFLLFFFFFPLPPAPRPFRQAEFPWPDHGDDVDDNVEFMGSCPFFLQFLLLFLAFQFFLSCPSAGSEWYVTHLVGATVVVGLIIVGGKCYTESYTGFSPSNLHFHRLPSNHRHHRLTSYITGPFPLLSPSLCIASIFTSSSHLISPPPHTALLPSLKFI